MANKVAFLFLTFEGSECDFIWDDFFLNVPQEKYCIFCHPKYPNLVNDFLKPYIIPETIQTHWGDPSLVRATILLLKYAFADKDVSHFILLSHNTAPLISFNSIYDNLQKSPKGYIQTFESSEKKSAFHFQWMIFPRNLVEQVVLKEQLIFLLLKLYRASWGKDVFFIFDEQWMNFFVHGILRQKYTDFFTETQNNRTYQIFVFVNNLSNMKFYKDYSQKLYGSDLDWRYSNTNRYRVPYIYSIIEYFNIRTEITRKGFFFIRKVAGDRTDYVDIKNRLGIKNLFS